ncbi:hypothetical protein Tco_1434429 [Tanacetum coccineum]
MSAEKAWNIIEDFAQYEEEGRNEPIFPEEGSLNYKNSNIEQLLGVMECQVDTLMKDAISLMGKSGDLCGLTIVEKLKEEIRVKKNKFTKIKKITRYPDAEDLEPLNGHKFSEALTEKASFHTPKFVSPKEISSVDELEPQLLSNFSPLDVNLGDKRGTDPPIKPHSPDSFRMKVVEKSTINTPPLPHMASFHPKDTY